MCYHRHVHFIPCNHIFSLDVIRFCASAYAMDSSPISSSTSSPIPYSTPSTSSIARSTNGLRPCGTCLAHPCTTYKVQRLCGVCVAERSVMEGRLKRLKRELKEVRKRVERLEREAFGEKEVKEEKEKEEKEEEKKEVEVDTVDWEGVEESLEEMGREVCRWEKMGWNKEEESMVVPANFDELDEE